MRIHDLCNDAETQFRLAEATGTCNIVTIILPPSCSPESCRLGFEKQGGISKLLVDKGIQYTGTNNAFRNFLTEGEAEFNDESALSSFLEQVRLVANERPERQAVLMEANTPRPIAVNINEIADTGNIVHRRFLPLRFNAEDFLNDIESEIIGQTAALASLSYAINTHVRKRTPDRPLSVLLAGKSGVGKTKTAEDLPSLMSKHTNTYWGYIRVDMNQLNAEHTVSRLIGAPPGYIGYGDSPLFEPLLSNKHQVILFDEMEKAHPKVMQMLMNAMANGRLEASCPMQSEASTFDFRKCILIFTTNIPLRVEDDLSQAEITRRFREELCKRQQNGSPMPQEIANRFSSIILYKPLGEKEKVDILVLTIVRLGRQYGLDVKRISTQLLQDLADSLELDNGVRDIEYRLESCLGGAFADFADASAETDVKLLGTPEDIQINHFCEDPVSVSRIPVRLRT